MNVFPSNEEHESQIKSLQILKPMVQDVGAIDNLISWHTDQLQRITDGKPQQFYRDWDYARNASMLTVEKLNAIAYVAASSLDRSILWDVERTENVITLKLRNPSFPAVITMTMNFKEQ